MILFYLLYCITNYKPLLFYFRVCCRVYSLYLYLITVYLQVLLLHTYSIRTLNNKYPSISLFPVFVLLFTHILLLRVLYIHTTHFTIFASNIWLSFTNYQCKNVYAILLIISMCFCTRRILMYLPCHLLKKEVYLQFFHCDWFSKNDKLRNS
jgi:hypothetical protein